MASAPYHETALAVSHGGSALCRSFMPCYGQAMSSIPPNAPAERGSARGGGPRARRPRYLTAALIAALVFGAGCWTEGCARLTYYRGDQDHGATLNASIQSDEDRARAEALYARYVDVADTASGRAVPMAAATFVLGAALLALAARGLGARSNTRSALMQVVAAQAIVVGASFFVLRDVREAELDWELERTLIHQREKLPPEQYAEVVPAVEAMRRWAPPGWLVVRTLTSGLIVLALSRPRAREFFEMAGEPVSER